jgi:hypothetical protein
MCAPELHRCAPRPRPVGPGGPKLNAVRRPAARKPRNRRDGRAARHCRIAVPQHWGITGGPAPGIRGPAPETRRSGLSKDRHRAVHHRAGGPPQTKEVLSAGPLRSARKRFCRVLERVWQMMSCHTSIFGMESTIGRDREMQPNQTMEWECFMRLRRHPPVEYSGFG